MSVDRNGPFPWMPGLGRVPCPRPPGNQRPGDCSDARFRRQRVRQIEANHILTAATCFQSLAGWLARPSQMYFLHLAARLRIWLPPIYSDREYGIQAAEISLSITSKKLINLLTYKLIVMRTGAGLGTGWGPTEKTMLCRAQPRPTTRIPLCPILLPK